jgi:hypothetical protein
MPICSENWLICHIDTAVSRRRIVLRAHQRYVESCENAQ